MSAACDREELPRDIAVALVVAYDGGPFSGFARQPSADTVQGRIEAALETVLRRTVKTVGAGRTDAGVHALGQIVSFDAHGPDIYPSRLQRSLNALCGAGIVIREVRLAVPGFSARFDASSREYRYRIVSGPAAPLFLERFAWHVRGDLDIEDMRRASQLLLGEHDFRSFCVAESAAGKRTVRRLDAVELHISQELGEECLTVRVVGNAFLHSMVRVIVGSLVEVGSGRRNAEWVGDVLAACERSAAGSTAPPQGLVLHEVGYPSGVWL